MPHRIHHDVHGLTCWDEWQHLQSIVQEAGRDLNPDAWTPAAAPPARPAENEE